MRACKVKSTIFSAAVLATSMLAGQGLAVPMPKNKPATVFAADTAILPPVRLPQPRPAYFDSPVGVQDLLDTSDMAVSDAEDHRIRPIAYEADDHWAAAPIAEDEDADLTAADETVSVATGFAALKQ